MDLPITESELLFKYTGSGSTTNPELSLGGTCSTNTIPSGVANNIFDDVTGAESASGKTEYRAIGIHNSNTTHVWMNTSIRVEGYVRSTVTPDTISFGVEKPQGTGGDPEGTIQTIASETVAPSGISWTEEGSPSAWVQISGKDYTGSIGPDDWAGIWLRRVVPAGASAFNNRSCTIKVQGETSASPEIHKVETVFVVHWTDSLFTVEKVLGDLEGKVL